MADPLQTNVTVQDVPEYLRDYRSALLNAAFGTVFKTNHPWFQEMFRRGTFMGSTADAGAPAPGAGSTVQVEPGDTSAQATKRGLGSEEAGIAAALKASSPKLLGMVWDPRTRTYVPEGYRVNQSTASMYEGGAVRFNEGGDAYQRLRDKMRVELSKNPAIKPEDMEELISKYINTGAVRYPGATNPFGNSRAGEATSSFTSGNNFSTKPGEFFAAPRFTGIKYPGNESGIVINYPNQPGTAGPVSPGAGAGSNPVTGGGGPQPGTAGSGSRPIDPTSVLSAPTFSEGVAGTNADNRGAGGYNPSQYATDERATGLAGLLGGKTVKTNTVGPIAPPPQNLIDFGDGAQLNAGLVDRAIGNITVDGISRPRTPSEMTLSLSGLRQEIESGGGDTSKIDQLINQNNQSYSSGAQTSPIGQAPPASPPNPIPQRTGRGGGASGSSSLPKPEEQDVEPPSYKYSTGRTASDRNPIGRLGYNPGGGSGFRGGNPSSDTFDRFAQPDFGGFYAALSGKPQFNERSYEDEINYASGGSLARFEIGDDGKVKNYRKGGAIRKADGGPSLLGFGTNQAPAAGGISNFWNKVNPTNPAESSIFSAPPVYGSQRVLGFGQNFGQQAPSGAFTSSTMTNQALSGLGYLPSVFARYEEQKDGKGTGRFYTDIERDSDFGKGVSNLNYATDISRGAAATGMDLVGQVPQGQESYLMSRMPGIEKMGFSGPITVDNLNAPSMQQGMGVNAPDPGSVIRGLGGISPALIQGQVPAAQMQDLRIAPVSDVTAGTITTDKFGQPQAQEYMSPYQRMVTDVQKEEAIRQANRLKSQRSSQAVRAGAFGGYRQGIEEGVAREGLQRQLGEIEATGQQRAYEQAQGQFERDRAASIAAQQQNVQAALNAALANQRTGLSAGEQNLAAGLSRQQLAAQQAMQQALANQEKAQQAGLTGYTTAADIAKQGMQQALQAQMANQQAGLTSGQANLQAALATQQLGTQAGLEAAKASQAGDLATWQMQLDAMKQASAENQQQRQLDFQNRLAAIQQAQSGAAGLAGLSGSMMNVPGLAQQLELQRLAALQQGGAAVDARTQAALDLGYQDFINQQNYPYQQLNFLQGILSGVPVGFQSEGVQFARPSSGGLTGLLTSGAGLLSNYYANK